MGASFSTRLSESNIELRNRIDAAATKVVLDSSFTDLTKLANEKYCNRLVKKVATIFQQNKDTVDLELLRQKLYDEMQKEKQKRGENPHVANADVANADVANADTEKTSEKHNKKIKTPRIQNVEKKCIQISKFYVLFAHLFSCIVSTINPTFKIEKEKAATSGAAQKEDAKSTAAASSLDFCSSRIDALVNGELVENSDGDLLVKPNVCKTNVSKSGSPLHLIDLPGMKALQQLYKDANANDGSEGEKEDARYLFKAFTGKDAPDHIRRLDQVPLKAYNKDEECKEQKSYDGGDPASDETQKKEQRRDKERRDVETEKERERERMFYFYNERDRKKNEEENARTGVYLKGIVGSLKERLFSEYVQHIKEMIERAESNRSRLLEILSEMFTYTYGSGGSDGSSISGVIINPSLTYKKLKSLVVQTRRIVIKLYTDCEEDYKHGLDIFFAMVQEKIAMKLSVQEEVLKKQLEDVMYGPPERYIPESLLYQQQFQGAEDFNKKQFVPPHFKSSVISIVKKGVPDAAFQQILPSLNEWMNEEIENATSLLDPKQVADEFLKENVYGDDDEYGSSAIANDVSVFSSPSSSPSAPAVAPYAVASASAVAPYAVAPPISTPSKAKTSFSKIATDATAATTSSKLLSGPSVSPSPKKVKTRAPPDIQPRQLSFISEE
jgi:hypothetical protein